MSLYGVGLDVNVARINNQFKMCIKARGGIGIKSIGTIFRRFDENGNKKLDFSEFEEALAECGYVYYHNQPLYLTLNWI